VALDSLQSSKLRSFLTLLGIILATTTLIAVMSVIHGMDVYIATHISNMGADGFQIVRMAFIGNFNPKKFLEMDKKNPQLQPEEFEFLRSRATLVREAGMHANRLANVNSNLQSMTSVTINGVTANWAVLVNTEIANGRYLGGVEDSRHVLSAVIGNDVKDQLFGPNDPVGKTIKIDGRPFTVVGVAKAKGSAFGQSQDAFVDIPIGTYFQIYGWRQGLQYGFLARDHNVLDQSQDEIRTLLRSYRHLRPKQDDTFSVVTADAFVSAWNQLTGAIAATAIGVVSVFMVVSGVVIMNIMLAVVTERTHEIGIRKSVGARRRDILSQFLVESSMLAAAGGFIGCVFAWTVALLVRSLTPVPMDVPASAVFIGIALSTIVGLFFGVYPAQQAAKLDPIAALRVEK
ncbi:MAG: ABC transporter permease, partial [Acidobacteriaceae bacterium]|nr:ABC transporter permease [Acidobacteriaceae bacterium]